MHHFQCEIFISVSLVERPWRPSAPVFFSPQQKRFCWVFEKPFCWIKNLLFRPQAVGAFFGAWRRSEFQESQWGESGPNRECGDVFLQGASGHQEYCSFLLGGELLGLIRINFINLHLLLLLGGGGFLFLGCLKDWPATIDWFPTKKDRNNLGGTQFWDRPPRESSVGEVESRCQVSKLRKNQELWHLRWIVTKNSPKTLVVRGRGLTGT